VSSEERERFFELVCSGCRGEVGCQCRRDAGAVSWWQRSGPMSPQIQHGRAAACPAAHRPGCPARPRPVRRRGQRRPLSS